jgi:hypothetical protein
MGTLRRAAWLLFALASGCGLLFPEFNGPAPDAAPGDGGALDDGGDGPRLSGAICALADLRDFHSCAARAGGGFRVTVEETRDVTSADASGNFSLPLAQSIDAATVAVIDPSGAFLPTVTRIPLANGVATGVALPIARAAALAQSAAASAVTVDPALGALLTWTIDPQGTPVARARAAASAGVGPLYEGDAPDQLVFAAATGARGTVAFFNLPAPALTVTVTPPAGSPLAADQFTLPIRPGALTLTTLVLPLH